MLIFTTVHCTNVSGNLFSASANYIAVLCSSNNWAYRNLLTVASAKLPLCSVYMYTDLVMVLKTEFLKVSEELVNGTSVREERRDKPNSQAPPTYECIST